MTLKTNVPAKRYDLFITAFEKEVERAQARIALMNKMQKVYEIVRTALEEEELPNPIRLELDPAGVFVTMSPLPNDRKSFFDGILLKIGAGLKRNRLHDGRPAKGQHSFQFTYKWNLMSFDPIVSVQLKIEVPYEGTKYIKVVKIPQKAEAYTYNDIKLEWLEEPEPQNTFAEPEEIPF